MGQLNQVLSQIVGILKPLLGVAGVVIAALYVVDLFVFNVPNFRGGQETAIAAALALWAAR